MGLFVQSTEVPAAAAPAARPRSLAQSFVREVHITLLQVFAYLCVFVLIGLAATEFLHEPRWDRIAASPARADWIATAAEPGLRGRQ